MRPTRRGFAVLAVAISAVVLGVVSGPRALNAVAAPLLAAVGFGAIQLRWGDEPNVDLHPIEPGFPESRRVCRIELDGSDVADIRYSWPEGLEGEAVETVRALPETVETAITLRDRGRYEVAAPTIHRRDALGVVRETVDVDETTTVVVYPDVFRGVGRHIYGRLLGPNAGSERGEFAGLREYTPGDPLRNIHWKSSAKRDEFLVTEFDSSDRAASVVIAASATPGAADAMATAAATLAMGALETGVPVGVRAPGRTIRPAAGEAHGTRILEALAGVTHGDVEVAGADIHIEADSTVTRVTVGGTTYRFDDLLVDPDGSAVRREATG